MGLGPFRRSPTSVRAFQDLRPKALKELGGGGSGAVGLQEWSRGDALAAGTRTGRSQLYSRRVALLSPTLQWIFFLGLIFTLLKCITKQIDRPRPQRSCACPLTSVELGKDLHLRSGACVRRGVWPCKCGDPRRMSRDETKS